MTRSDDQELLSLYAVEAAEHLGVLNESLLRLETLRGQEQAAERRRHIEILGRAAHSLKGASRAVGMARVEKIAHRMESIFDVVHKRNLELTPQIADYLYDALDTIQVLLGGDDDDDHTRDRDVESVLSGLDTGLQSLSELSQPVSPDHALTVIEPADPGTLSIRAEESIRVALNKLDSLMADASDLLVARSSIEQRLLDVKAMRKAHQKWQKEWRRIRTLYIRLARQGESSQWGGLFQFLNLTQRYMRQSGQSMLALDRALSADSLRLELISESLQDDIRRVRLVPFETAVNAFQRAIRDIAREQGKEVGLQISGSGIELDKRVLETIKDPILHLLRNAVDHGIEPPAERVQRGKAREGMIILALSQRGGNIMILVADDGRGIDVTAVRQAARRMLTSSEVDSLSDAETVSLVMLPGLSTRSEVTTISGRGIGLDVVRQNVEMLQGRVDIENVPGGGTTFRLVIPVSLSTLRCMLARIGNETYAIPTAAIEQILDVESLTTEAQFSAGGRPMITVNGRAIGLIGLADILERPTGTDPRYAMVLAASDRRAAFLVDDLITEQEMVVKNLNPELSRLRYVAGATLLGSGEVVIILNVSDLLKTVQTPKLPGNHLLAGQPVTPPTALLPILIVDNSITTRTLEKNILEAAGFEVLTAIHGLEALDILADKPCGLLVADIEMPYMDGFELTSRIRHSERFSQLPVILVTSLDSADSKERGFRVGADAYIAKGSFDQGELLQTIRQLIGRQIPAMNLIRVLVVEDSLTQRHQLVSLIQQASGMMVVGQARDGLEALALIEKLKPDVVSMDIRMPRLDGLEATRQIMEHRPTPIVIVSHASSDAEMAMLALEAGALAALEKPPARNHPDFAPRCNELLSMLRLMAGVRVIRHWNGKADRPRPSTGSLPQVLSPPAAERLEIVVIGASAGGPGTLSALFQRLPPDFGLPILVVQHLTSDFMPGLAEWLKRASPLPVRLAVHGDIPRPGEILIAPGGVHMSITSISGGLSTDKRIVLDSNKGFYRHQPAVDALFGSVAEHYGASAIGIVLTGMGDDGAAGLRRMRDAGARTIVQDEATCVVFGMPNAAITLGAAEVILPLERITSAILALSRRGEGSN